MSPRLSQAFALVMLGQSEAGELSPLRYLVNSLNSVAWRGVSRAFLIELARDPAIRRTLQNATPSAAKAEKIELADILAAAAIRTRWLAWRPLAATRIPRSPRPASTLPALSKPGCPDRGSGRSVTAPLERRQFGSQRAPQQIGQGLDDHGFDGRVEPALQPHKLLVGKRDLKTPGAVLGPGRRVEKRRCGRGASRTWSNRSRGRCPGRRPAGFHRLGPNQGVFQRPQPELSAQDAAEGLGLTR